MMAKFVQKRLGKRGLIWNLSLGSIKNKELAVYSFFTHLTYQYFAAAHLKSLWLSKSKHMIKNALANLSEKEKSEIKEIFETIISSDLEKQGEDYDQLFC